MRRLVAAITVLGAFASATPALGAVAVHGHRGGSYAFGQPVYPENTLPAFRNSAKRGWVLELDVKLTKDDRPLVIHDDSLDRTTACTGAVRDRTLADIRRNCPSDVLGSPGSPLPSRAIANPKDFVRLPTLAEVLALVRRTGATANIEIKNLPTDSDFDPSSHYADVVADAIAASRVRPSRLIVQSFWPPNLDVIETRLPAVATSLLTLSPASLGAPAVAAARGYEWVSPQYGGDFPAVAAAAHALGLRVVPWTLEDPASVAAAAGAGADAVITDDPPMAAAALR
jgi:glycerophosphoryl diester phosphodiesterase